MAKTALLILMAIMYASSALAASIYLKWDANTEPDLAGYTVYYSRTSGMSAPTKVTDTIAPGATFSNFSAGKPYYFAVTARNTIGVESSFSNTVFFSVPKNPTSLQLVINQLTIQ